VRMSVHVCVRATLRARIMQLRGGITRRNVTCYAIRARRRDITTRAKRDSYFAEHPPSRTNERTVSRSRGTGVPKFSVISTLPNIAGGSSEGTTPFREVCSSLENHA